MFGVGWVLCWCVVLLFVCGELVEKLMVDLCELNWLYVVWYGDCDGCVL